MQATSINTTCSYSTFVLFTTNPFVERANIMLMISLFACVMPAAFGIIVKDPPVSPNNYKYSYDIQDPTTGDSKSQHEVRQGDVVTGAYTVVGPDGVKRTVEYTADGHHGFRAILREEPGQAILVKQPPVYQPEFTASDFVPIPYQAPLRRPLYTSAVSSRPPIHYFHENPGIYFVPQNKIEPRLPFANGHYFSPAH